MKHLITITVLVFSLTLNSQIKIKYSKSERERITFHIDTVDQKYHYYFMLDKVKIGPAAIFGSYKSEYFQYNKKGTRQGTYATIYGKQLEIGTYNKKGKRNGNSFTTRNVNEVIKVVKYKKGLEVKNFTQKYLNNTNSIVSNTGKGEIDGFSNWSDGKVQIIGWWDTPHIKSPGLKRYEGKDFYIGDFKKGNRNGFGIYQYTEKKKTDIGYSKKEEDDGLMMTIDKNGKVLFAGYFEDGYYINTYLDNQKEE